MSNQALPWKRILAEFLVITAGVSLGLLGDDYREYRNERSSEQEYLRLLERDLERDTASLRFTRDGLEGQALAAQLIHDAANQGGSPSESVGRALGTLFFTWTYEQPRPTFLSLRGGGEFHVIQDPEFRSLLTDYYEISQVRLQAYVTDYRVAQQRLRNGIGRHVRLLPVGESDTIWPLPDEFVRLRSSLQELSGDVEVWNDVMELGARSFELLGEIDRIRAENDALRAEIQGFLR